MAENAAYAVAPGQTEPIRGDGTAARAAGGVRHGVLSWLAPLIVVASWELAARLGDLSPQVLPAPSRVVLTAARLIRSGELLPDLGISLLRATAGFVIGGAIGFALGVEGRDLPFQIDFSSWLITARFSRQNPDLVRAVNAAFVAEAQWASAHPAEAEAIAQRKGQYSDAIRDTFIAQPRRYTLKPVTDTAFIAQLQSAANWLSERHVLPEQITISEHLASV